MKHAKIFAGLALISALAAPQLASADTAPEEIVITGRYGSVPDNVQTLSQPVSYADLDLSTKEGREELRRRGNLTSRFLCDKLGESASGDAVAPSCRHAATKDAMERVGTLEESFAPRGTAWVRPARGRPHTRPTGLRAIPKALGPVVGTATALTPHRPS